jgi:hypothetical protein
VQSNRGDILSACGGAFHRGSPRNIGHGGADLADIRRDEEFQEASHLLLCPCRLLLRWLLRREKCDA